VLELNWKGDWCNKALFEGEALTGTAAVSVEARAAGVSYADWMRSVTTLAVEMEVNAQLGRAVQVDPRLTLPGFNA